MNLIQGKFYKISSVAFSYDKDPETEWDGTSEHNQYFLFLETINVPKDPPNCDEITLKFLYKSRIVYFHYMRDLINEHNFKEMYEK